MVYIVEVPLRAALMPISKIPWAELNRRGHNRPEPFLFSSGHTSRKQTAMAAAASGRLAATAARHGAAAA
eukprot:6842719-Prymnesium_polylepis.1